MPSSIFRLLQRRLQYENNVNDDNDCNADYNNDDDNGDDNDDDCLVAGPQRTGRGQKPASACSPKDQAIILIIITNNPPIIILMVLMIIFLISYFDHFI